MRILATPNAALATIVALTLLAACASPHEIKESGKATSFVSTRPMFELANCIDKNTDGAIGNSLVTASRQTSATSMEIVVRNAKAVWAVAVISQRPDAPGSEAKLYLGVVPSMAPETEVARMVKGCG